jgi:hypothetical protein
LRIKAKAFCADVQGREINRFELLLIVGLVDDRQPHRFFQTQADFAFRRHLHVFREVIFPAGVFQIRAAAELVPIGPMLFAIHAFHITVGGGVIRRHGRGDIVVRVKVPAAGIKLHGKIRLRPAGIVRFLGYQFVGLAVRVANVIVPAAT